MFEAGKGQSEMVKPVFQLLAADDDAEAVRVGEVGQTHAARLLGLREDDVAIGAMQGFPIGDPPFQGAPKRRPNAIGMTPFHLIEQSDGAKAGGCHQQRQDLLVPHAIERIGPGSPGSPLLLCARWPGIEIDAPRGRDGQAGFGGGGHLGVVGAQSHVGPHLLVVDVPAWHRRLRSSEDTRPIRPTGEANASVGEPALVGLRPPAAGSPTAQDN
jgi:hypothetical protein